MNGPNNPNDPSPNPKPQPIPVDQPKESWGEKFKRDLDKLGDSVAEAIGEAKFGE